MSIRRILTARTVRKREGSRAGIGRRRRRILTNAAQASLYGVQQLAGGRQPH
jgi:hypothetical protein